MAAQSTLFPNQDFVIFLPFLGISGNTGRCNSGGNSNFSSEEGQVST
jgi:hypothetical protein